MDLPAAKLSPSHPAEEEKKEKEKRDRAKARSFSPSAISQMQNLPLQWLLINLPNLTV